MKQNVYILIDKCSCRGIRVIFSDNDSTMCRDNLPSDIRSENRPFGLPFNDIGYTQIAEYDTELKKFINVEPREVDIMNSYQFKFEKPLDKKPELTEEDLNKSE